MARLLPDALLHCADRYLIYKTTIKKRLHGIVRDWGYEKIYI